MKPAHFQAALDGNVDESPFCNINDPNMSDIFYQVSPSGNSLLHAAASRGHVEIVELMARRFPLLILKKNRKGDTALHVAVRAGQLNTVIKLVECAKQIPSTSNTTESLMKMKNKSGNTVLHEALLLLVEPKKSVDTLVAVARYLVTEDPEVSYHLNDITRKSPLCLAVESNNNDILDYILKALPYDDGSLVECLEGESPVHVAIQRKKFDVLKIIKEQKEVLLDQRDKNDNTPLHCASSLGYFEGVHYLVEINSDQAFERNKEGFYPLHLACENGHVRVVQELLRKWPDPTELMGDNDQNILHVAAKNGKEEVVRFLLKQDGLDKLINEMDENGNTPLHLAALHHHSIVVASLLLDKRSNPHLVNYHGLTAYDICQENMHGKVLDQPIDVNDGNLKASGNTDQKKYSEVKLKVRSNEFQKMITLSILYIYHDIFIRSRSWCLLMYDELCTKIGRRTKTRHRYSSSASTRWSGMKIYGTQFRTQDLNKTLNNLFVVAALLVGVAFTGIVQMPIKDDKDGDNDYNSFSDYGSLNLYIDSIIITMNLSITAALTLCFALLLHTNLTLTRILISIAFLLLELAFAFVGFAFFAATDLTVDQYYQEDDYGVKYYINMVSSSVQLSLLTIPLLTGTPLKTPTPAAAPFKSGNTSSSAAPSSIA
ncbi:hypothetical protein LWI29_004899 [Acer saccharum]|uniref:PGG domain-containing protein n=1 Tax=Acer saccharum TaxID=4024 RepID=A0AA39SA25_ACESA|nr:hypothetical protein LWI29_004899 [Acer saccharum]